MDDVEFEQWFEEAWRPPGDRELSEWFRSYLRTFTALGRNQRNDVGALLAFFGVPVILTTNSRTAIVTSESTLVSILGAQVQALRNAGYGAAVANHLHTRTINRHAMILESDWTRYDTDGCVLAKFQATYGLTRMPVGWRITSVAVAGGL
jgi:hypothetical protein